MATTWPVVTVRPGAGVNPAAWETFVGLAMAEGAIGFEEREPREDGVPGSAVFYFPADEGTGDLVDFEGKLRVAANHAFGATGAKVTGDALEDQDWNAPWQEYYHRVRATRRIYVGPPEEGLPDDAPDDAIHIRIAYGRAFGTGGHPTTRGCLMMLEKYAGQYGSVLDVGTGSGVLSIAAVKLGAEYAVGMDHDAHCEEAFLANARLNDCGEAVDFIRGSDIREAVGGTMLVGRSIPDLTCCNMLSDEFAPLLGPLRRLRRSMILSGFLEAEFETLRSMLAETGWSVSDSILIEEWGTWKCEPDPKFSVAPSGA